MVPFVEALLTQPRIPERLLPTRELSELPPITARFIIDCIP
jgi:hypothetical protein